LIWCRAVKARMRSAAVVEVEVAADRCAGPHPVERSQRQTPLGVPWGDAGKIWVPIIPMFA
jgi:hypothetical protein